MRMRHWMVMLLAVFVLFAVTATPALAADPAGGDEAHGEKRELIIPVWAEVVAAIATFLILLLLLTKLAWKPILGGMQKREETIRKALDDAQKANEDALALLAQYQSKIDDARVDAQEIAEEARKDADLARRRIEEDATTRAEETLQRSLKDIEQAKHTALDEIVQEVGAIATEVATRVVRRELTENDNTKIVEDVVNDFVRAREGSGA